MHKIVSLYMKSYILIQWSIPVECMNVPAHYLLIMWIWKDDLYPFYIVMEGHVKITLICIFATKHQINDIF